MLKNSSDSNLKKNKYNSNDRKCSIIIILFEKFNVVLIDIQNSRESDAIQNRLLLWKNVSNEILSLSLTLIPDAEFKLRFDLKVASFVSVLVYINRRKFSWRWLNTNNRNLIPFWINLFFFGVDPDFFAKRARKNIAPNRLTPKKKEKNVAMHNKNRLLPIKSSHSDIVKI